MSFHWKQKLHSPYTGARLLMQPSGVLYIMQDGLTQLNAQNKCGNLELKENYDCFWVVTKSKICVYRYPAWHESVDVTVHSASSGRLLTELIMEMRDERGILCAEGRLELCVLDFARHRPQRLDKVNFVPEEPAAAPAGYESFDFGELSEHHLQTVLPHMVDMSGHMNNVEYVKVAFDCFDSTFTDKKEAVELECHYRRECKEGDKLRVTCKTEGDVSFVRLCDQDASVFEMKVIWRNRDEQ